MLRPLHDLGVHDHPVFFNRVTNRDFCECAGEKGTDEWGLCPSFHGPSGDACTRQALTEVVPLSPPQAA